MIRHLSSSCAWILLVLPLAMPTGAFPQATTTSPAASPTPVFAVSTVKLSGSAGNRAIKFEPGGRLAARNVTVRLLIKIAYNLNDDQLIGGPAWIGNQHFDVDATPGAPDSDAVNTVNSDRNRMRLQGLLTDRFQLDLGSEMRTMSTYGLIFAKGGPKLKPSQAPDAPLIAHGNFGSITLVNATMNQFANAVSDWVGHPVLDQTGLTGKYDFKLDWTPDQGTIVNPTDASTSPVDSGPTIYTALQQQLGLYLQLRKTQSLCRVVQRLELPTPN